MIKTNIEYTIKNFISESEDNAEILRRLHDLGLNVGQKIIVLQILSGSKTFVIQYEYSLLALNEQEIRCLEF